MENSTRLSAALENLRNRSFEMGKRRFDVTDVRYNTGRYIVYTLQQQTFVKDSEQFQNFLNNIRMLPNDELVTKKTTPMNNQLSPAVQGSVDTANDMTAKLKAMFDVLADKPTEEDFKKAEAMSKVVTTIVQVEQTKINYLKLQQR